MKASLNNIRKAVLLSIVALMALSIVAIYIVSAENQDDDSTDSQGWGFFHMRRWGIPFRGAMGSLTEEQRDELASEIQDLISKKFEEWGIEPPEPLLSDEQWSELQAGIEQLREEEATRKEIREFIAGKMEEWGIEPPEFEEAHLCEGARVFWSELSEEQRDELMSGIQELRDADASIEEFKDYINGKLEEWGVELPGWMGGFHCGYRRGGPCKNGFPGRIWKHPYADDTG